MRNIKYSLSLMWLDIWAWYTLSIAGAYYKVKFILALIGFDIRIYQTYLVGILMYMGIVSCAELNAYMDSIESDLLELQAWEQLNGRCNS
jgi:hypothetical protein